MKIVFISFLFAFSFSNLASAEVKTRKPNSVSKKEKPLVTIDVGGSSGIYNTRSYTEMTLGVNLNFTDWLTLRNAGFKRFSSAGDKDLTGLDSTLRFIATAPFDGGAFRVFVGPGYRWADPSDKNAVVGEAGVGLSVGRVGISGGAKYLKYDKVQIDSRTGLETSREDIHYFITLSGGAGLSF
ncbi:MAG: hypothetical protein WA160_09785 [Pseudobdellovibrio sp.]